MVEELTGAALAFGGSNAYSGVSTSRTLMLRELSALFAAMPDDAAKDDYKRAIDDDNVLMKPSSSTRVKTYAYLRDRFALDPEVPIFNVLRLLWERDQPGQPLMALLVAAFRDPVLRVTVRAMIERAPDQVFPSREFAQIINEVFPGKLKEKTLKSTGENTTSTYKQSGHLRGRSLCVRQRVTATPGSTTIALLLATLAGSGGKALLDSDWVRLLDSPGGLLLSEARVAASRGWLEYRHAGDVLEITFHQLMSAIGVAE
ncbi:MAG: hypothetical protein ACR2OE_07820 [Thermomicrobiales bacterium]